MRKTERALCLCEYLGAFYTALMSYFVVLQREATADLKILVPNLEIASDPDALLARIEHAPGSIRTIAIASDLEDPGGIAGKIRRADPDIGIVLLPANPEAKNFAESLAGVFDGRPASTLADGPNALTMRCEPTASGLSARTRDDSDSASDALRPEPTYAQSLLHAVDSIVILVGTDGIIREWNRRAEALYAIPRQAALGRSYSDLIGPEHDDPFSSLTQQLSTQEEPSVYSFESAIPGVGGPCTVLFNATLSKDECGAPAVLITGIDLTERKRAEQALGEARHRALNAEKRASITALTAGIAHDIGTPMTAILGYAELIAKSADGEKNRRRANTIVAQVHRVRDLIETLLNLSRTEERPPVRLDMRATLDKALNFYREKFKRHAVEVERDYSPAPPVLGDANGLHQVLLSLFLFSLETMPEGGSLRVSLAETENGEVEIRVTDTGTGVEPNVAEQIFESDYTRNERVGGTSLGLIVAKIIVEEHGGRILLKPARAQGTEFSLCFPGSSE
ncbi:MAG: hypothetical protein CL908_21785 [Deltaproteobacteria bacterium]|nr:hypothetical protein [Deltaproteobacteria bacterium]